MKYRIRTRLDCCPSVFSLQMRLRGHDDIAVKRDTELVIDGFPRSGNTFAVAAFTVAQPRSVRLARHLHAPAQVILAIRWRIPTIVVVRDPAAAVVSLVIRENYVSLSDALAAYIRFYSTILPYREAYVVARFEDVTSDFGAIVRRVNDRFGTNFIAFDHTPENEARALDLVGQMELADSQEDKIRETHVPWPSEARNRMKSRVSKQLDCPQLVQLRRDADRLWRVFSQGDGA